MKDEEKLGEIVSRVIGDNQRARSLSPAWIATQVMSEIHFPINLHHLGYVGCHLHVRQMARARLRHFDPAEAVAAAISSGDDLFPETLQDRYPTVPVSDEEPRYVLRDLLTDKDVSYNVERMRRAGRGLLKHADALEAWHRDRRSAA